MCFNIRSCACFSNSTAVHTFQMKPQLPVFGLLCTDNAPQQHNGSILCSPRRQWGGCKILAGDLTWLKERHCHSARRCWEQLCWNWFFFFSCLITVYPLIKAGTSSENDLPLCFIAAVTSMKASVIFRYSEVPVRFLSPLCHCRCFIFLQSSPKNFTWCIMLAEFLVITEKVLMCSDNSWYHTKKADKEAPSFVHPRAPGDHGEIFRYHSAVSFQTHREMETFNHAISNVQGGGNGELHKEAV